MEAHRKLRETGNAPMNDQLVKDAFKMVREGRCTEYVICDHTLNERFLAAARQLGLAGTDAEINTKLLNLLKQNKLKDCTTTHRKQPDPKRHHYLQAVSNAVRLVERQ